MGTRICAHGLIGGVLLLLAAPPVSSAGLSGVPPSLRKDIACMVRVANAMPGVDRVKSEMETGANLSQRDGSEKDVWLKPFVEYRVRAGGQSATLHFAADRHRKPGGYDFDYTYEFWVLLNGLSSDGHPNDWGAMAMSRQWKAQCGVVVNILYE